MILTGTLFLAKNYIDKDGPKLVHSAWPLGLLSHGIDVSVCLFFWVCVRALEPNGLPFWFHEDKMFICLAKLLKLCPHLDIDLSYIEKK